MAITIKVVKYKSAVEAENNGVFTSTIKQQIIVAGESNNGLDYLPSRVAAMVGQTSFGEMPLVGDVYPNKPLVTCRSVQCEIDGVIPEYVYTSTWSDENASNGQPAVRFNPLEDLPEVLPITGEITLPMHRDRNGNAILNAAGDPLSVTRTDQIAGFKIKCNVTRVPTVLGALWNSVNKNPIVVLMNDIPFAIEAEAARFWLPSDWISLPKSRNGVDYYEFRFELRLDFQDYHRGYPMNAGMHQILLEEDLLFQTVTKKRVAIVDDDGSEPPEPRPLDALGAVMIDPQPEEVIYLEVGKYKLSDAYSELPGVFAA